MSQYLCKFLLISAAAATIVSNCSAQIDFMVFPHTQTQESNPAFTGIVASYKPQLAGANVLLGINSGDKFYNKQLHSHAFFTLPTKKLNWILGASYFNNEKPNYSTYMGRFLFVNALSLGEAKLRLGASATGINSNAYSNSAGAGGKSTIANFSMGVSLLYNQLAIGFARNQILPFFVAGKNNGNSDNFLKPSYSMQALLNFKFKKNKNLLLSPSFIHLNHENYTALLYGANVKYLKLHGGIYLANFFGQYSNLQQYQFRIGYQSNSFMLSAISTQNFSAGNENPVFSGLQLMAQYTIETFKR